MFSAYFSFFPQKTPHSSHKPAIPRRNPCSASADNNSLIHNSKPLFHNPQGNPKENSAAKEVRAAEKGRAVKEEGTVKKVRAARERPMEYPG